MLLILFGAYLYMTLTTGFSISQLDSTASRATLRTQPDWADFALEYMYIKLNVLLLLPCSKYLLFSCPFITILRSYLHVHFKSHNCTSNDVTVFDNLTSTFLLHGGITKSGPTLTSRSHAVPRFFGTSTLTPEGKAGEAQSYLPRPS